MELVERARRAWSIRHVGRLLARLRMPDPGEVRTLQERDRHKYGSPHGPTFEWLLDSAKQQGLTAEQAYEAIIHGANHTSRAVNEKFGIEKRDPQ